MCSTIERGLTETFVLEPESWCTIGIIALDASVKKKGGRSHLKLLPLDKMNVLLLPYFCSISQTLIM